MYMDAGKELHHVSGSANKMSVVTNTVILIIYLTWEL